MGLDVVLAIFFSFAIGAVFGGMAAFLSRRMLINRQLRIAERKAARVLSDAGVESKNIVNDAKREADKTKYELEAEYRERRSELQRQEQRLSQKGENLDLSLIHI